MPSWLSKLNSLYTQQADIVGVTKPRYALDLVKLADDNYMTNQPPNLRMAMTGQPSSCQTCGYWKQGTCTKYNVQTAPNVVCDDYEPGQPGGQTESYEKSGGAPSPLPNTPVQPMGGMNNAAPQSGNAYSGPPPQATFQPSVVAQLQQEKGGPDAVLAQIRNMFTPQQPQQQPAQPQPAQPAPQQPAPKTAAANLNIQPRVRAVLPYGDNYLMEELLNKKYPENLGKLRFPGGGIEKNESKQNALVRELKEELGFDATNKLMHYLGKTKHPQYGHNEHYYRVDDHGLKPGDYHSTIPDANDPVVRLTSANPSNEKYMGQPISQLLAKKVAFHSLTKYAAPNAVGVEGANIAQPFSFGSAMPYALPLGGAGLGALIGAYRNKKNRLTGALGGAGIGALGGLGLYAGGELGAHAGYSMGKSRAAEAVKPMLADITGAQSKYETDIENLEKQFHTARMSGNTDAVNAAAHAGRQRDADHLNDMHGRSKGIDDMVQNTIPRYSNVGAGLGAAGGVGAGLLGGRYLFNDKDDEDERKRKYASHTSKKNASVHSVGDPLPPDWNHTTKEPTRSNGGLMSTGRRAWDSTKKYRRGESDTNNFDNSFHTKQATLLGQLAANIRR